MAEIKLLIDRSLIEHRQNEGLPTKSRSIPRRADVGRPRGREYAMNVVIVMHRESDLLQIVSATRAAGGFAGALNGRGQKRNAKGDNAGHNEKFNQREAAPLGGGGAHGFCPFGFRWWTAF